MEVRKKLEYLGEIAIVLTGLLAFLSAIVLVALLALAIEAVRKANELYEERSE